MRTGVAEGRSLAVLGRGAESASAAQEALYRATLGFVRLRARLLLRDDDAARDVAQETFVRALRSWSKLESVDNKVGWLLVTATRLSLDRVRHERVRRAPVSVAPPEEPAWSSDPERIRLAKEVLADLEQGRLITKQIVLHYCLDEMTQEETAAALRVSRKTVQRHLDAFRRRHLSGEEMGGQDG